MFSILVAEKIRIFLVRVTGNRARIQTSLNLFFNIIFTYCNPVPKLEIWPFFEGLIIYFSRSYCIPIIVGYSFSSPQDSKAVVINSGCNETTLIASWYKRVFRME